jgi:hypothetical protein
VPSLINIQTIRARRMRGGAVVSVSTLARVKPLSARRLSPRTIGRIIILILAEKI